MFGWKLIRKEDLKDLEYMAQRYHSMMQVHRWFSGWRDLEIIWDYIFNKHGHDISKARALYAMRRGTDEYGKPKDTP